MIGERDATAEARAAGLHNAGSRSHARGCTGWRGCADPRAVAEGSQPRNAACAANDLILGVGRTRVARISTRFTDATRDVAAFVLQIRRGNAMLVIPIR